MKKEERKKVSFDLSVSELTHVRGIIERKGMKLADFFREAVQDKIRKENKYMTIYVFDFGAIKKLTILAANYDITIRDASEEMIENVGAGSEGTLTRKEDRSEIESSKDPIIAFDDPVIEALLEKHGEVHFFTKDKY